MTTHVLAQLNIARLLAPLDDPMIADFKNALDLINGLGASSPGFLWQLKDDSGNSMSFRPWPEEPHLAINFTAWESIDALYQFTYYTQHTDFFRRRREWFDKLEMAGVVLWWHAMEGSDDWPTLQEAVTRLEHLRVHGPTPWAFTFKQRFTIEDAIAHTAGVVMPTAL